MTKRVKKRARKLINSWRGLNLYDKFIISLAMGYLLIVSAVMLWHRAWFSPDQFFAFSLVAVLILGRLRQFLWDWIPMILLLFGYEYLRGIIPDVSRRAHIFPMIKADNFLFGFIPTIKLQDKLFHIGEVHWYDYMAVILYISHFIIPMIVGFAFWLDNRRHFRQYMAALLTLSYGAFATYIIFPAMPPWMASDQGFLPPLKKIMDQVLINFAHPISVPTIYQFFGANLFAAVPSLHAAYPWLIFLFVYKRLKYLGLFLVPYVFGVWFSIVYLGEHYVIDAIIGVIYATIAYMLITRWNYTLKLLRRLLPSLKSVIPISLPSNSAE